MWSNVFRAVIFNVVGFSLFFVGVIVGVRHTGWDLLCFGMMVVLSFSGLRPREAKAPLGEGERVVWYGGAAVSLLVAILLGAAAWKRLGIEGALKVVIICVMCWPFLFLLVRDTRLAARGGRGGRQAGEG